MTAGTIIGAVAVIGAIVAIKSWFDKREMGKPQARTRGRG
jgi:hypothetical protein